MQYILFLELLINLQVALKRQIAYVANSDTQMGPEICILYT